MGCGVATKTNLDKFASGFMRMKMGASCLNLDVADAGAGPLRPSTTLQTSAGKGHPRCRTASPLRAQRSEESSERTITTPVKVPPKTLPSGLSPPPHDPPDRQHYEQSQETIQCASLPLCGEKMPEANPNDSKAKLSPRAATKVASRSGSRGASKAKGHCRSQAAQSEVPRCVARAATLKPQQPVTAIAPQKFAAPSKTSPCLRTPPGVQLGP